MDDSPATTVASCDRGACWEPRRSNRRSAAVAGRLVPTRTGGPQARRELLGALVLLAIAVSLNHDLPPVMHQPIDHRGRQRFIHVEGLASVAEGSIRGEHDRSGLIAGRHDLEQQVCASLVDRQVTQLVEEE